MNIPPNANTGPRIRIGMAAVNFNSFKINVDSLASPNHLLTILGTVKRVKAFDEDSLTKLEQVSSTRDFIPSSETGGTITSLCKIACSRKSFVNSASFCLSAIQRLKLLVRNAGSRNLCLISDEYSLGL